MVYSVHYMVCGIQCAVYSVRYTVCGIRCAVYGVQCHTVPGLAGGRATRWRCWLGKLPGTGEGKVARMQGEEATSTFDHLQHLCRAGIPPWNWDGGAASVRPSVCPPAFP